LNASTTCVSSCSFGEPAVVGRFGRSPSQSQERRPWAAAASSSVLQLPPGVLAVGRLAADRRRERHAEREDLLPGDDERAGRVDGDAWHPRSRLRLTR
jgi:hypothetical protein